MISGRIGDHESRGVVLRWCVAGSGAVLGGARWRCDPATGWQEPDGGLGDAFARQQRLRYESERQEGAAEPLRVAGGIQEGERADGDSVPGAMGLSLIHISEPTRRT